MNPSGAGIPAAAAASSASPGVASAAALVLRIQGGDAAAEEELVARFSPGLRVLLSRLTRDPALVEDIHQETLALVLTKVRGGELRQPEALAGFLRSTARNLLIGNRRKEQRYQPLDAEAERLPSAGTVAGMAPQLRRAMEQEVASQVRELLAELRHARDRELLVRYYLTEEPSHEICQDLDLEPKYFNRMLHRARQRMRELWERAEKRRRLGEGHLELRS